MSSEARTTSGGDESWEARALCTWRDETYLADMLLAARRAERYASDSTPASFESDEMLRSAVEYCLMLLGEAAARVSEEYRESHAEVEWSRIVGTRNQLIHGYRKTESVEVWRIATEDVPRLIGLLSAWVPSPEDVPDVPEWEQP